MVCYNILCTQAETKGDDEEETAAGDEEVRFNIYFARVIHSLDLNISSLYCQSDISYKDSSKNLDFNQTLSPNWHFPLFSNPFFLELCWYGKAKFVFGYTVLELKS